MSQPILLLADGMLPANPDDLLIDTSPKSGTMAAHDETLQQSRPSNFATAPMISPPTDKVNHQPALQTINAALPVTTAPTTSSVPIVHNNLDAIASQNEPDQTATTQPPTRPTMQQTLAESPLPAATPQDAQLPSATWFSTCTPIQLPRLTLPEPESSLQPASDSNSPPTTPTRQLDSGASSPLSVLSSPLSERSSFTDDAPEFSPNKRQRLTETFERHHAYEIKVLIDCDFDRDGPEGEGVLRLRPTADQWADFPAILHFAKYHGALNDGCFKVILPNELRDPIPEKPNQVVSCNAYRPKRLKNNFWRITTAPSQGKYSSDEKEPDFSETPEAALQRLKKLFCKNIDRRIRDVRYRVDVPAWTPEQRRRAGVPQRSPVHPLKGDELDFSRAIIPGIHTPYVYESAAPFGATFQIHAEDFKLISLNHLYKGRKIWIVIPSTAIDDAEVAFGRKNRCAQFMRHRAEFIFPDKLKQLRVPHRIVDQRPGETVVVLPDAYHQGFSTGYTLAEAKNYADAEWAIDEYQPCRAECQLLTAIPELFMRPIAEGEQRLDLCARYDDAGNLIPMLPLAAAAAAPPPSPPPPVAEPTMDRVNDLPAPPPKRELDMEGPEESKRVRVE